jgi:outer membrane autotransporter protein
MLKRGIGCLFLVVATVILPASLVFSSTPSSDASVVYAGPNINETYSPLSELGNPLELNNATLLESEWSSVNPYTLGVLFESLGAGVTGSVSLDQGSVLHIFGESVDSDLDLFGVEMRDVTTAAVALDNGSSIKVDTQGALDTENSATGIEIGEAEMATISLANGSIVQATGVASGECSYVDPTAIEIYDVGTANIALSSSSKLVATQLADGLEPNPWASGVESFNVDDLSILLQEDSQLLVTNTTTGIQAEASSWGLYANGSDQVAVDLISEAKIEVVTEAEGDESIAKSYGSTFTDNNQTIFNIDGQSKLSSSATAQGIDSDALAVGVYAQSDLAGSSFTFESTAGSLILSRASAADAATGVIAVELEQSDITIAEKSLLTAVATAVEERTDDETANAVALASTMSAKAGKEINIDINNSSIVAEMTANAIQSGGGGSSAIIDFGDGAVPSAVALFNYESATLNVIDSTLKVTAEATAQSVNGESSASIGTGNVADESDEDDFYDQYMLSGIVIDPNPLDEDRQSTTAVSLQNSTVEVATTAQSEDSSEIHVSGILMHTIVSVQDGGEPSLQLHDSAVKVSAQATTTSPEGETFVSAGGIEVQFASGDALILNSSIVDVSATALSENDSEVQVVGIIMDYVASEQDISEPSLELHDSAVKVSAQATTTSLEGKTDASAMGIAVMSDNGGALLLDNSSVDVNASGGFLSAGVIAFNMGQESVYRVDLVNGSRVSYEGSDEYSEIGAALLTMGDVEINIDSSSSIAGNIAVLNFMGGGQINNQGTISGAIMAGALHNGSTGVLQVELSSVAFLPQMDSYYSLISATLDPGTTFQINSTDYIPFSTYGESVSQPLLIADEGDWDQQQLNLTTQDQSSLLSLSWDDDSDANHLIVKAQLLTPEQAGLSTNATAAFHAAMADEKFTLVTDPDEWTPNVNGAFVAGMSQTLGTSSFNIGNRLGALMGLNSGDQVAANSGMWFSIRFSETEQDQRDGASGFDADSTGLTIGLDHEFGDTVFGFAYTRGTTDADADDNSADFDMSDNLFSLYSSYDGGAWYGEAIVSAGFGSVDGNRNVGSDVYQSDYDSNSYNAKVEMGLKFNQQGWQINPLLAMQYSVKEYDSYSETGSGDLALHVDSQDYSVCSAGLGAQAQKEFQRNWGTITPEVSGMVNYDLENDRIISTANFVGGSTAFVTKGVEPAETSWDLGAALTIASIGEQNVSLRLGYDYSGRQDFDAHSFTGKVRFEF